jgi:putative molybdopterin biosynthesis protein
VAYGHLPAALAVSLGEADCCIATRSAAQAFGLGFLPLATERYDLVIRQPFIKLPAVEALLDSLNRSAIRRRLEMLAGYDTSHTGEVRVS